MTASDTSARPLVDREHSLFLLREMLRIRRFEEKAAEMYSLQKIHGFLHLYIGEEATGVGAMQVFTQQDNIVATYREHGQALVRGMPARVLMAEMFGKATGCSRGHGGSMHFFDVSRRFFGGYAIVGGGLPVAVGLALADKMQNRQAITGCYFGDGAVAEGEFHESMNLAALWKLPVVFLCENNLYAMGTALERYQAQTDISRKAAAYGLPSSAVDGMDILAVEAAAKQAADYVRGGNGPYLLESRTYRFRAHSMADPDLYRTKEEIEGWKKRDPIVLFERKLRELGLLTDADLARIESEIATEIEDAVQFAEASPREPIEDLLKDVGGQVAR
ncbi:MAG TPA: pyruvate dehydrogenase (acetyl-transferring) E1 component subunit alpha [Candidatus Acidoferrales bacterium]|nr:pyruvate dehydrogenase (acetyl-transferring) E1 component subunit alpha [Candidatus Acidoferrales bacterium]